MSRGTSRIGGGGPDARTLCISALGADSSGERLQTHLNAISRVVWAVGAVLWVFLFSRKPSYGRVEGAFLVGVRRVRVVFEGF